MGRQSMGRMIILIRPMSVVAAAVAAMPGISLAQNRAVGIDVSAWQGTINWTAVARPVAQGGGGKQFAYVRSSRGGTTGFYDQSDPDNSNGLNTFSQRYDDPFFVSNMTGATANGMLAGPYHFARGDIVTYEMNAQTITHTGTDEADHFIQQAGNYMKPGYLYPVFDLEAGQSERSAASLSAFAVAFSDRIYQQKGIRPTVYTGQNYANYINSTVPAAFPQLWLARWPNQANPGAIDIQNGNPPASPAGSNVYGKWNPTFPTMPTPEPWMVWQYASTIHVPGIGNGTTTNVDGDVAHGDVEWMRDNLVIPAVWMTDTSGNWTDATRWNSNPGLPTANDRVVLDRPAALLTITIPSGTHAVRSLTSNERLVQTGGSLSTTRFFKLLNASTFSGGSASAGSIENSNNLVVNGGAVVTGAIVGTGSVNVSSGSLTAGRIDQAALVTQGTGVVRLNSPGGTSVSMLTQLVHAGGQIDLGDEAVVINHSGTPQSNLLRLDLLPGYASGNWDGPGIVSSTAAADGQRRQAIGYAEASEVGIPTTFLGRSIDGTATLSRLTLYGDANLNGTVNIDDFGALAANFNGAGLWVKGDFNYDASVNIDDFGLLAANFNQAFAGAGARGATVPEPASPALLALVALGRRSRRASN